MEERNIANGTTRTLAFQVPEELFERVKAHLKVTGLSQKEFVIGLIENALKEAEAGTRGGRGRRGRSAAGGCTGEACVTGGNAGWEESGCRRESARA